MVEAEINVSLRTNYQQISLLNRNIYLYKLHPRTTDNMVVVPKDIALLETGQLFASDECGHLWKAKLDIFRHAKTPHYYEIEVEFIADLLGTSTALTIDPNGSLYYYLPRDGAVLRWNSRFDIKYQSTTQRMTF